MYTGEDGDALAHRYLGFLFGIHAGEAEVGRYLLERGWN